MQLRIRAQRRPAALLDCGYCKEQVAGEWSCACGASLHSACFGELKRCPTLGCQVNQDSQGEAPQDIEGFWRSMFVLVLGGFGLGVVLWWFLATGWDIESLPTYLAIGAVAVPGFYLAVAWLGVTWSQPG